MTTTSSDGDPPPPESISFPVADGDRAIQVTGYLYRPQGGAAAAPAQQPARHPAMILMHGCTGLWMHDGTMNTREVAWAKAYVAMGYAALIVDSFRPRGIENMCSPDTFDAQVYDSRPLDAYAALAWLQGQDFIAPDRIGLMGWSQGGGAVLLATRADYEGRPAALPGGDFRAAVAMYPGSCHASVFRTTWTTSIPILVLIGGRDVWTPADPCRALTATAASFGGDVRLHVYPTAYHDFDWPDEALTKLPQYTTSDGGVPIIGMDPVAAADAHVRVPAFLADIMA
jgi:dienelactone hydrolase